jgi:hypothetical protein
MINEGFCENQTILDVLKLIFSFMGSPLYLGIYGECLFYLGGVLKQIQVSLKGQVVDDLGFPHFWVKTLGRSIRD